MSADAARCRTRDASQRGAAATCDTRGKCARAISSLPSWSARRLRLRAGAVRRRHPGDETVPLLRKRAAAELLDLGGRLDQGGASGRRRPAAAGPTRAKCGRRPPQAGKPHVLPSHQVAMGPPPNRVPSRKSANPRFSCLAMGRLDSSLHANADPCTLRLSVPPVFQGDVVMAKRTTSSTRVPIG